MATIEEQQTSGTTEQDALAEVERLLAKFDAVAVVGVNKATADHHVDSSMLMFRLDPKADADADSVKRGEISFDETMTSCLSAFIFTALSTLPVDVVFGVMKDTVQQFEDSLQVLDKYAIN